MVIGISTGITNELKT